MKNKIIATLIIINFLLPLLSLAVDPSVSPSGVGDSNIPPTGQPADNFILGNPIGGEEGEGMIWDFLVKLLQALMPFFEILLVFYWVLVGYNFLTAQGNVEKIKSARQNLIWAAVGTAIVVGAEIILRVLRELADYFRV